MNCTLTIAGNLELKVEFTASRERPETATDPAEPAEIDIVDVYCDDKFIEIDNIYIGDNIHSIVSLESLIIEAAWESLA